MATDSLGRAHWGRALPLIAYSLIAYFMTSTTAGLMNVAVGYLEAERGWDAYLLSASISVASFVNVPFGFVAGQACTKWSAKRMSLVWAGLYVLGLAVMGLASELWFFIVGMCLANAASSAWGYNTLPVIITNWFPKRKGAVQGFVSMGIVLGNAFTSMIYTMAYAQAGHAAGLVPFIVLAVAGAALLVFGVSDYPEQRGLVPDTLERCAPSNPAPALSGAQDGQARGKGSARELLRNARFMATTLVMGLQLLYVGGIMVQLVPRLLELGLSVEEATLAMVGTSVVAALCSFGLGIVGDKLGVDLGVELTYVLGAAGVLINLVPNMACTVVSLVLIGAVTGTADNWPVNVCAERFGRKGFSETFGLMQPIIQLVGALGPAFFALIAASFGGYTVSYVCGAVLMLAGLVAYKCLSRS